MSPPGHPAPVDPRETSGTRGEEAKLTRARDLARAEERAVDLERRLGRATAGLLDANQALAQVPLLEFRMEELQLEVERLGAECSRLAGECEALRLENASLCAERDRLQAHVEAFEGSKSWRLLAPLRRARALLRR